jgi:hypothetical protein
MKWCQILTLSWYKIGSVLGGLFFMTLGVLLIIPLPLDGEWTWESSVGSPLLGFLVGIPVFILGLWTLTFGLRSGSDKSLTGSVPLIDEWIGEQGNEEEERAESQRLLLTDEKLLKLVAARGQPGLNRLAVTNKRVVVYYHGNVQNAISYEYGEVDKVKGRRNVALRHLGEITVSAKGSTVSLKNVGIEYVNQVVTLVSKMKR